MNCCPLPAALTTITATTCPVNMGQIQRVFFVRRTYVQWDTVTPANNVPAAIATFLPTVVAGWTILRAAVGNTKVVIPPLFGGDITITPGEAIKVGGNDNTTLNGETYVNSYAPSTFAARFDSLSKQTTADLKELRCESLEVYFVNQDGDIIGRRVGDLFVGFNAKALVVNSRSVQGFGTRDSNTIDFQLDADWDAEFEIITPTDFNALTF
jgi:hypothetical protein